MDSQSWLALDTDYLSRMHTLQFKQFSLKRPFPSATLSSCSVKHSRILLENINCSGAIFVAVSQSVLTNGLIDELSRRFPGIDPGNINSAGATGIRDIVPVDLLPFVLEVYNSVVRRIFIIAVVLGSCSFIASLFFEWKGLIRKDLVMIA
jgi:hypothetical protein